MGLFDQDIRNMGKQTLQQFERVSAQRVSEVQQITNRFDAISRRVLGEMGGLADRIDTSLSENVGKLERLAGTLLRSVVVMQFTLFAYVMLYKMGGGWKGLALGVILFGVNWWLLRPVW